MSAASFSIWNWAESMLQSLVQMCLCARTKMCRLIDNLSETSDTFIYTFTLETRNVKQSAVFHLPTILQFPCLMCLIKWRLFKHTLRKKVSDNLTTRLNKIFHCQDIFDTFMFLDRYLDFMFDDSWMIPIHLSLLIYCFYVSFHNVILIYTNECSLVYGVILFEFNLNWNIDWIGIQIQ